VWFEEGGMSVVGGGKSSRSDGVLRRIQMRKFSIELSSPALVDIYRSLYSSISLSPTPVRCLFVVPESQQCPGITSTSAVCSSVQAKMMRLTVHAWCINGS